MVTATAPYKVDGPRLAIWCIWPTTSGKFALLLFIFIIYIDSLCILNADLAEKKVSYTADATYVKELSVRNCSRMGRSLQKKKKKKSSITKISKTYRNPVRTPQLMSYIIRGLLVGKMWEWDNMILI